MTRTLLLLVVFTSVLCAQFDTGAVLGTVRDRTDAVVPGARVTLTNVDTGISVTKETDDDGNYEFSNVKTGRYRLNAVKAGFTEAAAEGFMVSVGARQRVDLAMSVGQI